MDNKKMVALNEEQLEKVDGGAIFAISSLVIAALVNVATALAGGVAGYAITKSIK